MQEFLVAIEASNAGGAIRTSIWLYPVANVLHVLCTMSFFAAVAAMDVKVWRAATTAEIRSFIRCVRPYAIVFFALQSVSGLTLFLPEASHTGHNAAFQLKLVAILLALANVAALESVLGRTTASAVPSPGLRASAAASLALWLTVATFGRLIAYF